MRLLRILRNPVWLILAFVVIAVTISLMTLPISSSSAQQRSCRVTDPNMSIYYDPNFSSAMPVFKSRNVPLTEEMVSEEYKRVARLRHPCRQNTAYDV